MQGEGDFSIAITYEGGETTLACVGELDVVTVPKLRDAFKLVIESRPRRMHVDGRGITLLSSDAIDALIDAAAIALAYGIEVEVELNERGRRIADLAGAWWVGRIEDPLPAPAWDRAAVHPVETVDGAP